MDVADSFFALNLNTVICDKCGRVETLKDSSWYTFCSNMECGDHQLVRAQDSSKRYVHIWCNGANYIDCVDAGSEWISCDHCGVPHVVENVVMFTRCGQNVYFTEPVAYDKVVEDLEMEVDSKELEIMALMKLLFERQGDKEQLLREVTALKHGNAEKDREIDALRVSNCHLRKISCMSLQKMNEMETSP